MGQKLRRAARLDQTQVHSLRSSPFKVFEYNCPECNEKRSIQYFHRNGVFLEQTPRVVCGSCHKSIVPKPYKALEFECPMCRAARKVRVPAKPVPLERYDSSLVTCPCGFRGEAPVGRIMHLVCEQCLGRERQMVSAWTENGASVDTHCEPCGKNTAAIALPSGRKAKAKGDRDDFVFTCCGCQRIRPLQLEDMVKQQGVVDCVCGWSGYPEHVESAADYHAALQKLHGMPRAPEPPREDKREGFKRAAVPGSTEGELRLDGAVPSPEPLRDKPRSRVANGPATMLPKVSGPAAAPPRSAASFGALGRLQRDKPEVAPSAGPRLTSVLPRIGD